MSDIETDGLGLHIMHEEYVGKSRLDINNNSFITFRSYLDGWFNNIQIY